MNLKHQNFDYAVGASLFGSPGLLGAGGLAVGGLGVGALTLRGQCPGL
jgi:hypothetical protein